MNKDDFWKIIDDNAGPVVGCGKKARAVEKVLKTLPPEEVISYSSHLFERFNEAFRWDLWAIAYIVNGGCSDDGFVYFCMWLISKGRAYFEAALVTPEAAANEAIPNKCECEAFLYPPFRVYQKMTGQELPTLSHLPTEPRGEPWEESKLETIYPELWKRFVH